MADVTTPLSSPILEQAEQKIESSLTAANRADYMKIVVAGMKAGMQGGPNSILVSLQKSKNPVSDCAVGAIHLCMLLRKQSRNTMPVKAMVPAATTLMLHALDFVDKTGLVKIGTTELVKATHIFANEMMRVAGIKPGMLQTAAAKVHAITQDPQQLAKLKQMSGGAA